MTAHLGDRVAALADGELGHRDRDRALAHIAHCADCRAELATQRAVKALLGSAAVPPSPPRLAQTLHALAAPGSPPPPRATTAPTGPLVPELPPPGRSRTDSRGPGGGRPGGRPGRGGAGDGRTRRRAGVVTAGALSVAGLVLATAFVAGGSPSAPAGRVVPPVAELSVEHSRTTGGVTVGDPGPGLMPTDVGPAATSTRR